MRRPPPSWPTSSRSCRTSPPVRAAPTAGPAAAPPRARPRVAILADGIDCTHGVSRTIEEIRQRGVPGHEVEIVGTDPRSTAGCRRWPRSTSPSTRACGSACPACRGPCRRLIDGRFDAIHVCSPGPGGDRRRAGRPRPGSAAAGQLPHRADRLCRPALGRAEDRPGDGGRREAPSTTAATSSSPPAPPPTRRWRRSASAVAGCCAGTAASTPTASTPTCAAARPRDPRADRRPLLGADHAREGRRAAGRGLPARPARRDPRLHLRARRRRPRAGTAWPSGSASTPRSSAGSTGASWPAPTPKPTSSFSPAPPTPSAR